MSDIPRLLRPTIRASQQRKKFADGGVPTYDPMTGVEIGADGPGDDLAARPSAISRGADKFMSRAFGDDIDTYGTGEAPPNGAFDLPSHYGILPPRQDGRRYSYIESLRNPVDALANDIRTMRRAGKGLIESTVSGAASFGDAMSGKLPMVDEDGHTSQEAIRRAFDAASLAGGASAAGTAERAAARAPGADVRILGKRLGQAGEDQVPEQLRIYPQSETGAADATATATAAEAPGDVGRGMAGSPGGGEGVRAAQLQAQRWAGPHQPIEGLPRGAQLVDGELLVPGPVARVHDVARDYMQGRDYPDYPRPEKYHPIDTDHARAIAQAFEDMPHAPNDPQVIAAYDAMIAETLAQYQAIKQSGLKLTPTGTHDYPYTGNPRAVARDVAENNHMAFFKTDEGFGSPTDLTGHPMLRPSGEKIGNHDLLYNDIFRIVHDYFGHIKHGYGFRAAGEDNAFRQHAAMYSPLARRAMTTETRGQNSWLNYGPHGDHNRTALAADTVYAPQKVGLMPEWAMYDRAPSSRTLASDSGKPGAAIAAAEHAKPFYSHLEQTVEALPVNKATGEQWLGTLNNKGVKPEEMDWTGLRSYLAENTGKPVTKAQVQEHLGANKMELGEVRKGDPYEPPAVAAKREEFQTLNDRAEEIERRGGELTPQEYDRMHELSGELAQLPNPWLDKDVDTKFEGWQLPGGGNYREKLLTLPRKGISPEEIIRRDGSLNVNNKGELAPAFTSTHWNEPNVLVHRRTNDRTYDIPHTPEEQAANAARGSAQPQLDALRQQQDAAMREISSAVKPLEAARRSQIMADVKAGKMSGPDGMRALEEYYAHPEIKPLQDKLQQLRAAEDDIRAGLPAEVKPKTGKALHIEEIQSDWHQIGRKQGYETDRKQAMTKVQDLIREASTLSASDPRYGEIYKELPQWQSKANERAVPDAPFKKNWHELALKDAIREAAEKGHDRISWTPGDAQAERYDLSKQIESLKATPIMDQHGLKYEIRAKGHGGTTEPINTVATEAELPNIVGKEMAQKIVDQTGGKKPVNFTGLDLKVGGDGMRGFYDKMIPDALNKIGKPHGVKVQRGEVGKRMTGKVEPQESRLDPGREESFKVVWEDGSYSGGYSRQAAEQAAAKGKGDAHPVHYMDIPQSLKDQALKKGFSLFEDSGAAGKPIAAAAHINTPQFREWFGDSQVVTKDGTPQTLYHGTPNHEHAAGTLGGFDTFDRLATSKIIKGREPGMDSVGSWFSDLPTDKGAGMYAGQGSIYPVHLRVEHPWEPKDFMEFLGKMHEEAGSSLDAARKKGQPLGRVDPEPMREWLQSEGYDGIKFPKGTVDGKEQTVWIALEPNQIKSATGNSGEFSRSSPSILREDSAAGAPVSAAAHAAENARISTRLPTGKKNPENALAEDRLKIDMESMQKDPGLFAHNVGLVSQYPNLLKKETRGKPTEVARRFIDYVSDNLLHLYDQVPENIRGRSKKWYEGGNKIVNDFATEHNVHPNSSAGVVAALSPQKDWFQNVDLARRVHDIHFNRRDAAYDPKMETTSARIFGDPKFATGMDRIRGKTYGELDDIADKAMWLRLHDEAHNARSHRLVTPEGEFGDVVRNANGAPSGTGWGSLTEIGKAIQSLEANGDVAKISGLMGERHKVRNFYNNLIDPHSPHGDVTIDTHAVAAGLMRPLSGNSMEVAHNFGNYPGAGLPTARSSAVTGVGGTYGLYADAYRKAAEARGITPREMQSVTWEAIRGLFKDTWKSSKKNTEAVDAVWRKYQNGLISKDDARTQISTLAGGIDPPSWHEPAAGGRRPAHDEAGRNSADPAELSGNGVPGGDAAAMVGGAGSGAAPSPATALNSKKRKPRNKAEGGAVGDDYNTPVPDEQAFQQWKAANAPDDSGIDYDLRGAYLANMQRAENGHMGDAFKKPNHPTFSDQSQYAVGDQRSRAGYWVGDTFVPPVARGKGGRVRYAEGGDVDDDATAAPVFDPTRLAAVRPPAAPAFDPAKLKPKVPGPMSATDVFSGAVENAPDSAWQFVKDIVRPITHPIETATGIKDLGLGLLEKSGAVGTFLPPTGGGHEKYADAMMDYIKNRYGGVENIKKTIAKDPVGALSDASMILTGGGSLAARAPGILGKTGEIIGSVGRTVDPLMAPINAAKVGTKVIGETLTHTGATPLENAYKAGVEGGDAGEVFRGHMRGTADSVEPVEMAKRGLAGYRAARGAAYREGMGDITSIDRQMGPLDRVLDFGKIENAVDKTERLHKFGVMDINQPAATVRNDMMGKIAEWKALPPLEYHTLEGLDALKKSLGQVMMATEAGSPARTAAGEIYNAVRKTIVDYDPKYAKVMEDYEKASTQIKELEKAMSLGQKATADTALRKLQSIMRNNVNTNYGRRLELGKLLEENGATHLMSALSGQSLSAWAPRGLGKLGAEFALLGSAGHFISPWTLAAAPLMSPRIMGEVSHGIGRTVGRGLNASGKVLSGIGGNRAAANASYRLGRSTNPYENEDPANPYAR